MKLARFRLGELTTYGFVEGDYLVFREEVEEAAGFAFPPYFSDFVERFVGEADFRRLVLEAAARAPRVLKLSQVKLLAPTDNKPKVLCIGLNYRDHAEESKAAVPDEPIIFLKPHTALTGPYDPVEYPSIVTQLDYEAELAVVIGRRCRGVKPEEALEYVCGYAAFNDISARNIQFKDRQWTRGKSFDTFAPLGPWIVTRDEIPNPHNLRIASRVNGETRQDSNTRNMIFGVDYLVSFISMVMTLEPGDVIATGTPAGVGIFAKPEPRLLKIGDVVEVEVEGVGVIRNTVVKGPV
ncbi:MAG: fumarylacetoacetate hydrolase family protein [Nitrososphaerota archaeon]|nr:fumarylacetoacetate hydrolase family protein [Candidatus Calditenuaceae archaeon]MDW8074013.1 fumarylacetoacetate hydrolase family protein [Nitrososphaerota archaeon]